MATSIFTSESVCAGHPDKICDQISDAILDAVLTQDPKGHVAVETVATYEKLIIAGEVSSHARVDYEEIARKEIRRLGYIYPAFHFSDTSNIDVLVHTQSPEIAVGVEQDGAGDQGMMFGYACKETTSYMPLPIALAHALAFAVDHARETKAIPYLFPDGKTQASIVYEGDKPVGVANIVIAVPHHEDILLEEVHHDLYEKVVLPVLGAYKLNIAKKDLVVNGTSVWHQAGPASDTGLTGRKIIVDSYGGYARVGGGAFSGKDPTKVDRSGAYAARYLAKNIVAHDLCKRAEVRLAYIIGKAKPVQVEIESFGTHTVSSRVMHDFIYSLLDTSVKGIIDGLSLQRPIYHKTAAYGHFGRDIFPWEAIAPL